MPAQDLAHDRDDVAMLVGQASLRGVIPLIGLAALLTAALLYWIMDEPGFAAGFGAAIIGASVLAYYCRKLFPAAPVVQGELPDWTIARAAADSSNTAIAVTDRAGRLVCASDLFGNWFEGYPTPPGLPLDGNGAEKLATAGRAACSVIHSTPAMIWLIEPPFSQLSTRTDTSLTALATP